MLEDSLKRITRQRGGAYAPLRQIPRQKAGSHHRKRSVSTVKGPGGLIDRTLECRHEIKYLISEPKAMAIARFIDPYLNLDYYSQLQPGGAYPIVTLYLDSGNLELCRESLQGHKNRFKLRIRSYTDDLDYPRFFEIKRRLNSIIIKNRARVKHKDIPMLLSGLSVPPQDYKADENLLKQFQFYMNTINAGPVIRVRYMRQAYEDYSDNRVRVTFDRKLYYNVGNAPDVSFEGLNWHRYSLNGVILEVKFTGRYPAWLSRMVKCFNLRAQSISKYTTSIKKSYLLGFCAPKMPM